MAGLFKAEAGYLIRGLAAWPLALLVALSTILLTLAYQAPVDWTVRLGPANPADFLYLQSFNPGERTGDLSFRWSTQESYFRLAGAGRLPRATIELDMQVGGRPAELGLPKVQLWEGQRMLGEYNLRLEQSRYSFEYRPEGRRLDGNLILYLRTLPSFRDSGHNQPLGVVVSQLRVTGGPDGGRPVIPALPHLAYLLAFVTVIYLAGVRTGWRPYQAAAGAGLPLFGLALVIAAFRFHLTPAVEELWLTTLLAYPLMTLGLRVSRGWLRARGLDLTRPDARWLGLVFVAVFVVKVAGLNHPVFQPVDHWFRIHQINRFWDNPAEFWQQYYNITTARTVTGQAGGSAVLGQWGVQVSLPYSPLFYIFAAPLSLIWPGHNDPNLLAAVNLLAGWLEASQVFLLYILARLAFRADWSGRAGWLAGAIYGFAPLSFLLFSDGGYNSIFAGWLTLLFITLLVDWLRWPEKSSSIRLQVYMVLTLAAGLLAHTSTFLLLSALLGFSCLLLLTRPEWRSCARRLAWLGLAGLAISLALYYAWYIPGLVSVTLPTLLGRMSGGVGLGQDNRLLGAQLLSGFWPQLWEHFRLWPFGLTLVALVVLTVPGWRRWGGLSPQPDPALPVLWAWLATFGLFALADLKANLLQKHMLFAAPLLSLGSGLALGLALAMAWQRLREQNSNRYKWWSWRGWLPGLVIAVLLIFNLAQGLIVWYARVYYLIYQPGAG